MTAFSLILLVAAAAYLWGWRRAGQLSGGHYQTWHSLAGYHAWWLVLVCAMPALIIWLVFAAGGNALIKSMVISGLPQEIQERPRAFVNFFMTDVARVAGGGQALTSSEDPGFSAAVDHYQRLTSYKAFLQYALMGVAIVAGFAFGIKQIGPRFRARNNVERAVSTLLLLAAGVSILTTAGIVFSVLFESLRFFARVPPQDFLLGLHWSPQAAIRADQVGAGEGAFGAVPLFAGTLLITLIAMCVAIPIGLLSAIYLSEYATPRVRSIAKPLMEILAGIPTVVYGFFAALTVAPFFRNLGDAIGLDISSESALAAGMVMGIMIIPFVSSLSDDAINAVPRALRDASLGLGATRSETMRQVLLPAALPGIIAGFLLAISRAIGETMIVVMAAGLAANLTANPFEAVTTVTVQIVTLLTGDQEFDSAKTLSAFALGLTLFVATLLLNVFALYILNKYREKYD